MRCGHCIGRNEVVSFQFSHTCHYYLKSAIKQIYLCLYYKKKTVLSEINRTLICTGEQINVYNYLLALEIVCAEMLFHTLARFVRLLIARACATRNSKVLPLPSGFITYDYEWEPFAFARGRHVRPLLRRRLARRRRRRAVY